MKRVLCVWLPHWPLQRILSARPELRGRGVVLCADSGRNGLRVVTCSREAAEQGVEPEMPVAEAKALLDRTARRSHTVPNFVRHDPKADRKLLRSLAQWCQQFTPRVGIEESHSPDSLLLDITGCAHLFGDERELIERVVHRFHRRGFIVRAAVSDTIGAAWAVAHFGRSSPGVVPSGQQGVFDERLHELPVEGLRLSPECVQTLHDLGIEQIGQLAALPRKSIPSRFGPDLLRRLDQAMGRLPESVTPERPYEYYEYLEARWTFEDPTADRWVLEDVLEELLERVIRKLQPQRHGVQRLLCRLDVTNHSPVSISLELLQPSVSKQHILELLHMQLERQTVPSEISEILLRATVTAPLECRQNRLFDSGAEANEPEPLARLLERMSHRLGRNAVLRPQLVPDAQPERACRLVPALTIKPRPLVAQPGATNGRGFTRFRPLRLLPNPVPVQVVSVYPEGPPVRFCFNGFSKNDPRVARWWGPERIETGWWRGQPIRRDYYRVEDVNGRRFWLFRSLDEGNWFLHGIFE